MKLELSEFWHILGLCNKYHDWVTVPGYRLLNSRLCETAKPWFQNSRPRLKKIRASETQNHPKTKLISRPITNASAISRSGQNFPRPTLLEEPFYTLIFKPVA